MISASQLKTLTKTLTTVRQWREAPVLNHSDLRLKNVIVDADGLVQGHAWRHHRIGTHAHAPKRRLGPLRVRPVAPA